MNDSKNNKQDFEILRRIAKNPNSSQRELSRELGYSLGKLNYCLKALQKKGLIKIKNFKKNKKKINYIYILTCLLYTSPSPRDGLLSRMPSSA